MALHVLWAGWRAAYIDSTVERPVSLDAADCLFCHLQRGGDEEMMILERTTTTFTVMNAYPYSNGHVMVVPLRHEAAIEQLDRAEGADVFGGIQRAARAIRAVYRPDGLNVGANLGKMAGAGVPGHLHVHVLPRWSGDTNFMTAVADTRVMPEPLEASWARLRAAWPEA